MKRRFLHFLAIMLMGMGVANAQSTYKLVDIEHHFGNRTMFDAYFLENEGCTLDELPEDRRAIYYTTLDLGAGRIAAMDAAGVDFAQLSLSTPGAEAYGPAMGKQIAKEANDSITKAIAQYPDRIGGWMTLYPEDVEWSLQEIDRCTNMGLYGWACRSNMNGKRLDDPKYQPIFKKLEALGMPVYLHPESSKEQYSAESEYCINVQTAGSGADALTTFTRMVSRGLFDECPNLKIILGHVGEGFPSFKDKVNASHAQGSGICNHQHEPSYYVDHNVWITTSRNSSNDVLRSCLDEIPSGHVLMSTDYPYQDLASSVSFIRSNKKLTHREKVSLLSNNAIALGFSKLEPTNVSMDYSKSENWLKQENNPQQNVDVFYLPPTCVMNGTNEVEYFSEQDKLTAAALYEQQAKLFEGFCNIYAPYYRQIPVNMALSECQDAEDMATNIRMRAGKDDVFAALDYYFENLNTDRPFILASHSQGSAMMRPVLDTYMKEHPEYYKRMVACYALGASLPLDWFDANEHLKKAEDATSTGVVIGWNTEGPEAKTPSLLIGSNDYVINPLSWKCDDKWVSETQNLGSLIDGQVIPGYADAQIDLTRRALICTTDINYVDVPAFGDRCLHGGDWSLYWGNIQQNAKDRIENYNPKTVIIYTAEDKLIERTNNYAGLHPNAFKNGDTQVKMSKHEFADGTGTITFDGIVNNIGEYAFYNSIITSVTIPDCVTNIGEQAFYDCLSLTSINIPSSVTSIGDKAFSGCSNITSINIPSSVTSIGEQALASCRSITSITVDPENPSYKSDGNCLITKTLVGNLPVNTLIAGCQNSLIPDYVTSIYKYAFYGQLPIQNIVIPASVKSIGKNTFANCLNLTTLTCESDDVTLGKDAFNNCHITNIYVPKNSVENYKTAENWSTYADKIKSIPYEVVIAQVDAIDIDNIDNSRECNELIGNARKGYDILSNSWKAKVPDETLSKLVAAEAALAASNKSKNQTYRGIYCNNEAFYQSGDKPTISIRRDGNKRIAELRLSGENEVRRSVELNAGNKNNAPRKVKSDTDEVKMVLSFSKKVSQNKTFSFTDQVDDKTTTREEVDAVHGDGYNIHFERNFTSTKYEAISLPFDLPAEKAREAGLTLYRLNMAANAYGEPNEQGFVDEGTEAVIFRVTTIPDGQKAVANRPYLVKANQTGKVAIDLKDATLNLAKSLPVTSSTTMVSYVFAPSVTTVMAKDLSGKYVVRDGMLVYVIAHPADLPAWRWYMEPSIKGDVIYYTKYQFIADKEEDSQTTDITEVETPMPEKCVIYNLNGQRVTNPMKGNIYIINGKKVLY